MSETPTQPALTKQQASAIARASASHRALEKAQRMALLALGRAQPMREAKWADRVATTLSEVQDALRQHRLDVLGPGGLYDELRFEAPWLLSRVNQLVAQLARVEAEAADLSTEVERVRAGDLQAISAIRYDAERMLALLRDLLAKEADLTFERFNQPPALD